jgi:hypothetical protein
VEVSRCVLRSVEYLIHSLLCRIEAQEHVFCRTSGVITSDGTDRQSYWLVRREVVWIRLDKRSEDGSGKKEGRSLRNECERKKATAVKAMELHWDNSKLLTIRNE